VEQTLNGLQMFNTHCTCTIMQVITEEAKTNNVHLSSKLFSSTSLSWLLYNLPIFHGLLRKKLWDFLLEWDLLQSRYLFWCL